MGGHGPDLGGAVVVEDVGRRGDGAGGVDHVVDEDAAPALDVTDDAERLDALAVLGPRLVDDGEVGVEVLGELLGHLHAAGVGGDDDDVARRRSRAGSRSSTGMAVQVVDRAVEEALDLAGVEVDAHDAIGAGRVEQVGDELGGDRLAALGLAVLAGVAVVGAHRGDALGRGPLGRVDHDQLLHDRRRSTGGGWVWMMNTSAPRTDSSKRQRISPLGSRRGWARRARCRGARRSPRPAAGALGRRRARVVPGRELHRPYVSSSPSRAVACEVWSERRPRVGRRRGRRARGRRTGRRGAPSPISA